MIDQNIQTSEYGTCLAETSLVKLTRLVKTKQVKLVEVAALVIGEPVTRSMVVAEYNGRRVFIDIVTGTLYDAQTRLSLTSPLNLQLARDYDAKPAVVVHDPQLRVASVEKEAA